MIHRLLDLQDLLHVFCRRVYDQVPIRLDFWNGAYCVAEPIAKSGHFSLLARRPLVAAFISHAESISAGT